MERNQSDKPTETHHHDHSHSHSHSAHDLLNTESLYIDIHDIGPGKVTFDAVAEAHQKDLETQDKHGVHFIKYWVNEEEGKVYCLSKAPNSQAITETHKEAHGLMPTKIILVTEGQEAQLIGNKNLYLDIHKLGPGMVTAKAVAEAHEKDLAVQDKYGVNFINYWVDEKEGIVVCLCEASDPSMLIKTHNEAHGLLPDEIRKVQQGE